MHTEFLSDISDHHHHHLHFDRDQVDEDSTALKTIDEDLSRMKVCARFILTAATNCDHGPTFYRSFACVVRALASNCESSRVVVIDYSIHKTIHVVMRGIVEHVRQLFSSDSAINPVSAATASTAAKKKSKSKVVGTPRKGSFSYFEKSKQFLLQQEIFPAAVDILKSITLLVSSTDRAHKLFTCAIFDISNEILRLTCQILSKILLHVGSVSGVAGGVVSGVSGASQGNGNGWCWSPLCHLAVSLHIEALQTCLAFAQDVDIRSKIFSSSAAGSIEEAASLLKQLSENTTTVCEDLSLKEQSEDRKVEVKSGDLVDKSIAIDNRIDFLLQQQMNTSDCVIA